ncbi:MAG: DNA repair protein RecO [Bacilli bacterium]|nr:DNA repair protein RecO [Bacilli bacterium]
MAIMKLEGIIIGETLFGESSKILKVFTKEYGIISVMSRGCRKPKSTFHEASNKLIYANFDIKYKDNGISTLIGVSIIKIFKNIIMDYRDFIKKVCAFSLVDLTSQVIDQKRMRKEEISDIYDIFISAINKIDERFNSNILMNIVRLKYLEYLGVRPSIDCCSNCGSNQNIVTITASSYGYVCRNCYTNEKMVRSSVIKLIRMLFYVEIDKIKKLEIDEVDLKEIEEFIDEYYEEHTGIYLKTKDKFKIISKTDIV